jgi:hypothetical protein
LLALTFFTAVVSAWADCGRRVTPPVVSPPRARVVVRKVPRVVRVASLLSVVVVVRVCVGVEGAFMVRWKAVVKREEEETRRRRRRRKGEEEDDGMLVVICCVVYVCVCVSLCYGVRQCPNGNVGACVSS